MTKQASVVVLCAVAAPAIAWFWLRSNEPTISTMPKTPTTEPDVPATETASAVTAAAAVEDNAAQPHASRIAPREERVADAAKTLTDAFDRGAAPSFVDYLTSKGLSREDSEKIVAEGVRDMATCLLDAAQEQAAAQGVASEDVLNGIQAGDPPMTLPRLFLSDRVPSCITSVQQRIGLPPTVRYELRAEGSAFELRAQVLPE